MPDYLNPQYHLCGNLKSFST